MIRSKNFIDVLKDKDGQDKTNLSDILTLVHSFYSDLYTNEDIDKEALDHLLSRVKGNVKDCKKKLDSKLSLDELTKAIDSMQNNKAPGADGQPKEFYVTFWSELKLSLLEMYNESLHLGSLPPSLREGTISLLFKKGDKEDIKNWRPLTLLGVDRKILAKVFFLRIQEVIEKLIGAEQTCAIPGRSMSDSLALIRDSYLYATDRDVPLCITGLDLEKAFDRVSHTYVREMLVRFGFGPQLRAWIELLYFDCSSRVNINGYFTEPIKIQSGVRQGCPLSVCLFVLAMEPLACGIRTDTNIRGLPIPGSRGKQAKISLYMDDVTVICTTNDSMIKALQWCEQFSLASGAKLNRTKSEILYLNWPEKKPNIGLVEKTERIKIWGVEIGKSMETKNWEKRLPAIKGKLLQWEERELTLTGKVLVIKAEVLASLTFLAATLPAPKPFLLSLRCTIFQFIWNSKQEHVKREIMCKPLCKGGKAVPDLKVKFDALFLTPILNAVCSESNTCLWHHYASFWVGETILRRLGSKVPLCIPHAENRPTIYDKALMLFKTAKLNGTIDCKISRKEVEENLSPRTTRLVSVGILTENQCIRVWQNVNSKFLLNEHKDLAWKIVQNCIPTRAFLKKRRTKNSICPMRNCNNEEDVTHRFWSCSASQAVWETLKY